jgi:ABC-2 type transport system permease protein
VTRTISLIARFEVRTTLGRKSFWLTAFLLPAAVVAMMIALQLLTSGGWQSEGLLPGVRQTSPIGLVDTTGSLDSAVAGILASAMVVYPDEHQAQDALRAGAIARYYLPSADYLSSGALTVVQTHYQPLAVRQDNDLITYTLNLSLTHSQALAALLLNPTPHLATSALAPPNARAPDNPAAAYMLPYLLMFTLYLALVMTSGFTLQSVSKEKENRTAEMLLVSLRPRDLMLGKIVGLSAVGLLQVATWLAAFFISLRRVGGLFGVSLDVSLGVAGRVVPWMVAYFLAGYVMYAAIYAVIGVLSSTLRDANHFIFAAIVPLIVPLLFVSTFATAPNGPFATTLSVFPLTSPVSMMARLGATPVPWWQAAAGLVLLGASAYLFVLLAARLFGANHLLSTRALTWNRLVREVGAVITRQATRSGRPAASPPLPDFGAFSKSRLYKMLLAAAVFVVVGAIQMVRDSSAGIIFVIAGVLVGGVAWYRYRQGA